MSKRKQQRGPTPPKNRPVGVARRKPRKRLWCWDCEVVVYPAWTEALGSFLVSNSDGRIHGPSLIEPVSTADYLVVT